MNAFDTYKIESLLCEVLKTYTDCIGLASEYTRLSGHLELEYDRMLKERELRYSPDYPDAISNINTLAKLIRCPEEFSRIKENLRKAIKLTESILWDLDELRKKTAEFEASNNARSQNGSTSR